MQARRRILETRSAVLLIGALAIVGFAAVSAEDLAAEEPTTDNHSYSRSTGNYSDDVELTLHHSYRACGKKWVKKTRQLSAEQLAWVFQKHHGLYELTIEGRVLMTLELLSGPSIRHCDIAKHWTDRETTVRLTFHFLDGSSKTELRHYARDDVYFFQVPKLYPQIGRVLLTGIDVDGNRSSRWILLEPLKTVYREAKKPESEPYAIVAAH